MSISMSGANLVDDQRSGLKSSEVDQGALGEGATANTRRTGFLGLGGSETTGAALAGVTQEFATKVSNEIENYKTEINNELAKLEDKDSEVAFKGSDVKAALAKFIVSVREVAQSYTEKLSLAEKQIIASVQTVYSTQDAQLAGDMNADSGTLEGQKATN